MQRTDRAAAAGTARHTRLALVIACIAAAVPAEADPPPEALTPKLQKIERAIEDARAQASQLAREREALARELDSLRREAVAAAASVQASEARAARLEADFEAIALATAAHAADLDRRRSQLANLLAALVRLARLPREALLVMSTPPVDGARRAMLLAWAAPELERQARALQGELAALDGARQRMAVERDQLAAQAAALDAARARLDGLIVRRAALQQQNEAERRAAQTRIDRLSGEASDLRNLIDRLAAERAAADTAESSAAAGTPAAAPQPRIAEARGGLVFPAPGHVVAAFGQIGERGAAERGLTLETRPGATIVAPFAGQTAYAGPFRSYGLILIIDHGGGYHSILTGLGRVDLTIGQWVTAGEPVAAMDFPASGNPRVYLELRRNGQPIDPLPWLAAPNGKVSG